MNISHVYELLLANIEFQLLIVLLDILVSSNIFTTSAISEAFFSYTCRNDVHYVDIDVQFTWYFIFHFFNIQFCFHLLSQSKTEDSFMLERQ